jgi:hypothetical protein
MPSLLLAALALALPGCSYQCHFEARGRIWDAASGELIPNVQVQLVRANNENLSDPTSTNQQGEFQVSFCTVPSMEEELSGWKLVLSAKGYETQRVAVGPVMEPKRGDVTVYLVFHAAMRKTSKGD